MVNAAKDRATSSGITYEPIEGNRFTGSPPAHPPNLFLTFIAQAVKQHAKAYYDEVKVDNILSELYLIALSTEGVKKKDTKDAALNLPVLSLTANLIENVPDNGLAWAPSDISITHPYDCILAD